MCVCVLIQAAFKLISHSVEISQCLEVPAKNIIIEASVHVYIHVHVHVCVHVQVYKLVSAVKGMWVLCMYIHCIHVHVHGTHTGTHVRLLCLVVSINHVVTWFGV